MTFIRQKSFLWTFVSAICILSVYLLNCTKPTEPEYDPTRYSGIWEGNNTTQNLPLFLSVNEEGVIDSVAVGIRLSAGLGYCTTYFFAEEDWEIESDSFNVPVKIYSGNVRTILHGHFSNDNKVSGTYNGFSGSFSFMCGSSYFVGTGYLFSSGEWEATMTDSL